MCVFLFWFFRVQGSFSVTRPSLVSRRNQGQLHTGHGRFGLVFPSSVAACHLSLDSNHAICLVPLVLGSTSLAFCK